MILGKIRMLSYIFLIFLIPKLCCISSEVNGLDKITAKTTK